MLLNLILFFLCIIILLATITVSYFAYLFFDPILRGNKKENKEVDFKKIPDINFDNEIKFLNFLIDNKVETTKKLKIEVKEQRKEKNINDEMSNLLELTAMEVLTSISPIYKAIMSKYFTEEGLYNYILVAISLKLRDIIDINTLKKVHWLSPDNIRNEENNTNNKAVNV